MAGHRRSILALCLLISCFFPIFSAAGSETVTYSYDARGRLVQVARSGTVNNGVQASYSYDKADNRINVTVTGAGGATLTLSPTSLPNGTVGTAYSQTITASGGSGGYTYAKTSGTLPAGLALNGSTGVLSGTPTAASTYSFTITATDSASNTGNRAYSVTTSSGATCNGVSFSVGNTATDEGTPLVFTVTKSGSTSSSCSVTFATANGTAVAPGDYTAATSTILAFTSTQTTRTVSINTVIAGPNESTEYMYLNLSSPTGGATISDSQGVGTIYNYFDDGGGGCDPVCP
jgi:hypothetical protein